MPSNKAQLEVIVVPLGESAVTLEFGQAIDPQIHRKVKAVADYIAKNPFPGMIEYVSAFASITVFYDPLAVRRLNKTKQGGVNDTSFEVVSALLRQILYQVQVQIQTKPRIVEIPVCYGYEFGPDLECVAQHNGLESAEVVHFHTSGNYLVYMIGFAPGFPYLGGMSERIAAPRRKSPRMTIPAGSVGIAGLQTGVYPIATPGGWQLIGRTPVELFRPWENPPSLLQTGDIVRFVPITRQEFEEYEEAGQ